MSKIYEALLRAEQERATKTGNSAHGVLTAEEIALANTLEPYVPVPEPSFGERSAGTPDGHVVPNPEPVFGERSNGTPRERVVPLMTEPPSVAPLPSSVQREAAVTEQVPRAAAAAWVSPTTPPAAPASFIAPAYAPAPPTSVPAQAFPQMPSAASAVPVATPPAFETPAPAASFPANVRDADDIRILNWHPVMERLPALDERGQSVEQFRSLRSRLAEFRDSSVPLKSLLITSGLPQEGKSFIAANLALSLSRHRANRVLLIDGDIRRSSLHAMLGTPVEPGLTEYLSGKAELTDVLQRCKGEETEPAFHNGLSSLTFIAGGSEPDKAADLSGSPRFAELLQTLAPSFDWIIIDSSPVNLVSDGVNFARACDGVLLVAREGVTKFETAQHAQQQLKSTRLLGFVLNAVHTASSKTDDYNYGPYGTYGSYGGYGYSTTKR